MYTVPDRYDVIRFREAGLGAPSLDDPRHHRLEYVVAHVVAIPGVRILQCPPREHLGTGPVQELLVRRAPVYRKEHSNGLLGTDPWLHLVSDAKRSQQLLAGNAVEDALTRLETRRNDQHWYHLLQSYCSRADVIQPAFTLRVTSL